MHTQLLTSKLYRPPAARRHGAAVWPGGPAAISRCALWRGRHPTVGHGGAPCSLLPPPGPRPSAPPLFCRRRAPSRPPERPPGSAAPPRRRPTHLILSAAGPEKGQSGCCELWKNVHYLPVSFIFEQIFPFTRPVLWIRIYWIRIQHFKWIRIRFRIQGLMTKNRKNTAEKFVLFWIKYCNLIIPRPS
jgi:hypothetical protein